MIHGRAMGRRRGGRLAAGPGWHWQRWGRVRWLSVGLAALCLLVGGGAALAWPVTYQGRMYPGVAVLGVPLGGLPRAAAAARIERQLNTLGERPITFQLGDRTWTADPAELGFRVNLDATLDRACRHGRGRGFFGRYAVLFDPGDHQAVKPLVTTLDETVLNTYLDRLAAAVHQAPHNARLTINGTSIAIQPARHGAQLDRSAAWTAILTALQQLAPATLTLPLQPVPAPVTADTLTAAQGVAARLISQPVTLTFEDRTWQLSRADLAKALVLPEDPNGAPRLDPAKLNAFVAPIAAAIDRAPRNATVAWDDRLVATRASEDGIEVNRAGLVEAIARAAQAAAGQRAVTIPVSYSQPEIDSDHLDRLGITTRLGHGTSSFAGSSDARATNVAVAARHITGTLIAPGDTFSFNDALGPITLDEGYVEGKIISGDWYASDIGGGVCQVSTTVYRAALLAGMPFTEWHPHSFRLGFYELDGWPPGIDAAIYQPEHADEIELDLKFVNPTDHWLLLQVTTDGDTLVADLYGAPTGYTVTLSDLVLGPPIPPPDPIERDSADLPAGDREVIQTSHPGVEVTLTRAVTKDSETISNHTFVSDYHAQPEIVVVGTGTGA